MIVSEIEDFNFKEFESEDSSLVEMIKEIKRRNPKPSIALVIPMQSFRTTVKKLFKHVKGLSQDMVIGPSDLAMKKGKYDLSIVDEGHRLRQRKNLSSYFKAFDDANKALNLNPAEANELDWVKLKSKQHIIFYDSGQSIKPSDVHQTAFDQLRANTATKRLELKTQFRVSAGNNYAKFIDDLFHQNLNPKIHKFRNYELKLFTSIRDFKNAVQEKEKEHQLSRMIAGFSWEWKSKKNKNRHDIEIELHRH